MPIINIPSAKSNSRQLEGIEAALNEKAKEATLQQARTDIAGVKTTVDSVKTATTDVKTVADDINTKIGTTNQTEGSATSGTLMAKINKLLADYTTVKAAAIDTQISSRAPQKYNLDRFQSGSHRYNQGRCTGNT